MPSKRRSTLRSRHTAIVSSGHAASLTPPRALLSRALDAAKSLAGYRQLELEQYAPWASAQIDVAVFSDVRQTKEPQDVIRAFASWGTTLFDLFRAARPIAASLFFDPVVHAGEAHAVVAGATGAAEARALSSAVVARLHRWWQDAPADVSSVTLRVCVIGEDTERAGILDADDPGGRDLGQIEIPEIAAWRAALGPWPGVTEFDLWFRGERMSAHELAAVLHAAR